MDGVTQWTAVEVPGVGLRPHSNSAAPARPPSRSAEPHSLPLINERESNPHGHCRCPRLDSSLLPKKVVTTGLAAESY